MLVIRVSDDIGHREIRCDKVIFNGGRLDAQISKYGSWVFVGSIDMKEVISLEIKGY